MPQDLSLGKKWVSELLEQLGHARHEWGSGWDEVPKRRGSTRRGAEQQLILSESRRRKIVWLPTEDLRRAGAKDGMARANLRETIADAVSELLHRTG